MRVQNKKSRNIPCSRRDLNSSVYHYNDAQISTTYALAINKKGTSEYKLDWKLFIRI